MITSKLTSKGQTTIPQAVRAALGLREGDEIAYAIEEGRVVLTSVRPDMAAGDPFVTFPNGTAQPMSTPMLGCEVWGVVECRSRMPSPVQQRLPALVVAIPDTPGALELLWC